MNNSTHPPAGSLGHCLSGRPALHAFWLPALLLLLASATAPAARPTDKRSSEFSLLPPNSTPGPPGGIEAAVAAEMDREESIDPTVLSNSSKIARELLRRAAAEHAGWETSYRVALLYLGNYHRPGWSWEPALLDWHWRRLHAARRRYWTPRPPGEPSQTAIWALTACTNIGYVLATMSLATPAQREEALALVPELLDLSRRVGLHLKGNASFTELAVVLLLVTAREDRVAGNPRRAEALLNSARQALTQGIERALEARRPDLVRHLVERPFLDWVPEPMKTPWAWETAQGVRSRLLQHAAAAEHSDPSLAVRLLEACAALDHALALRGVGVLRFAVLAEAERALAATERLPSDLESQRLRGELLVSTGRQHANVGNARRAEELLQQALTFIGERSQARCDAQVSIAEAALGGGRAEEAERHAQEAIRLLQSRRGEAVKSKTWNPWPYAALLNARLQLGDLEGAVLAARDGMDNTNEYWQRFFALRTVQIRWNLQRVRDLQAPIQLQPERSDPPRAAGTSRTSAGWLRWVADFGNPSRDTLVETWRREAQFELAVLDGNRPDAERALRAAIAICGARQSRGDEAYFRLRLGRLLLEQRRGAEVRRELQAVVDYGLQDGDESLLWQGFFGLGETEEQAGRAPAALRLYRRATEVGERLRLRVGSAPENRARAVPELGEVYGVAARLEHRAARAAGKSEAVAVAGALAWAQAYHAQVLEKELQGARDAEAGSAVEKKAEAALLRELQEARVTLGRLELERLNLPYVEAHSRNFPQIDRARQRLRRAESRLREQEERLPPSPFRQRASLAHLQTLAGRENAVLLDYLVTEKELLLFCITGRGARLLRRPVTRDRLTALVSRAATYCSPGGLGARAAGEASLAALYDELVRPIAPELRADQPLIVAPDGPLHGVPWAALIEAARSNAPAGRRYLAEAHPVGLTPSLDFLVFAYTPGQPAYAVVCGPDYGGKPLSYRYARAAAPHQLPALRYALQEARQVATALHADARLQRAATRTAFLEGLRAGVCWFVGHAFYHPTDPSKSALVLAGPGGMGEFTVHDLVESRHTGPAPGLRAGERPAPELVTISACESAAGPVASGEGPLSLAWALQYAGARSVVACRWKVDDRATSLLMARFARNLAAGMPRLRALQQAQLATRRNYGAPVYWAAPVLYGRIDPIELRPAPTGVPLAVLAGSAAIILAGLALRYRRRKAKSAP